MVITFDFDDTLLQSRAVFDEDGDFDHKEYLPDPNPEVWPELEAALERGDTVYIVTSRTPGSRNFDSPWETVAGKPPTQEEDLKGWLREWRKTWPVISKIKGIRFTSGALKSETLAELGSQQHYDDDTEELDALPPGCEGIQAFPHPSWRPKRIDSINEGSTMRITEGQLRKIIRAELNEMSVKGATFHKDPITGKWVTGMEDLEGRGALSAMKMREPQIMSVGSPSYLRRKLSAGELEGFGDEDVYNIMDDPDAADVDLADLPGGAAQEWYRKHRG